MENSQQKVKFIPIFVEGRDEPVIHRSHDEVDAGQQQFHSNHQQQHQPSNSSSSSAFADSSSSSNDPFHNHSFPRPPMGFGDMSFGQDMHMPSMPSAGSIFDRAKDFPVRDFFNSSSARRSESPIGIHRKSQERQMPVHPEQQQQRSTTPQRSQPETKLPTPPPPTQQPEKNSVPATQKKIEDSIEKIQRIQQSVMDLMGQVEQYDGSNPKEYVFLDEMLTQNLLKLDDIDAEGKENIKSARREAIKCINHLIQLLEMKRDEAKNDQVQNQVAIYDENQQQQPTSAEESLEQKISSAASTAEASQ